MAKLTTYRGIAISPALDATPKQARNLIDLAAVLRDAPPPKFNMGDWVTSKLRSKAYATRSFEKFKERIIKALNINNPDGGGSVYLDPRDPKDVRRVAKRDPENICGTSCCALGTAAYRGVGSPQKWDSWIFYAENAFGVEPGHWRGHIGFKFLFDGEWEDVDNTPKGAAARVLYYVTNGYPPTDFSHPETSVVDSYQYLRRMKIEPKPVKEAA